MAVAQHSALPAPQWMSGLGGCPGTPECSVPTGASLLGMSACCYPCKPVPHSAEPCCGGPDPATLSLASESAGGLHSEVIVSLLWLVKAEGEG